MKYSTRGLFLLLHDCWLGHMVDRTLPPPLFSFSPSSPNLSQPFFLPFPLLVSQKSCTPLHCTLYKLWPHSHCVHLRFPSLSLLLLFLSLLLFFLYLHSLVKCLAAFSSFLISHSILPVSSFLAIFWNRALFSFLSICSSSSGCFSLCSFLSVVDHEEGKGERGVETKGRGMEPLFACPLILRPWHLTLGMSNLPYALWRRKNKTYHHLWQENWETYVWQKTEQLPFTSTKLQL